MIQWKPETQQVVTDMTQFVNLLTIPYHLAKPVGLVEQSKALLLREWYGYNTSGNSYAGRGRRVYENQDADTGEGYSYSSSANPMLVLNNVKHNDTNYENQKNNKNNFLKFFV